MSYDKLEKIINESFEKKEKVGPKSDKKLVENYKIEPQYCIFFEDIARNLKPAHELGMKTVWIKNNEPWAAKFSDAEFINYKTDKLSNFLRKINETRWTRKNY